MLLPARLPEHVAHAVDKPATGQLERLLALALDRAGVERLQLAARVVDPAVIRNELSERLPLVRTGRALGAGFGERPVQRVNVAKLHAFGQRSTHLGQRIGAHEIVNGLARAFGHDAVKRWI
ncbi:hypothetical protein EOB59_31960 [Mesorhizobium sp. M7A.F.Ca.MR.176.00.0.0]|nr:hypothetical protein EOB59_31960 [Mesorhizobium sp. M7A.F.Ca.MR.176.00.0.0]